MAEAEGDRSPMRLLLKARQMGKNGSKIDLLLFLISFFIAIFTLLAFWNGHRAISTNVHIKVSDALPSLTSTGIETDTEHLENVPESVCLSESCLVQVAQNIARSFPPRERVSWCVPSKTRGDNSLQNGVWQGILLVKVPKAASSTSAGLALRIGNRTQCAVQWEHREARFYANRSKTSFLFGSVRRPASRNLSSVWFFMVAPLGIEPTDNNIIQSLHTHRGGKTKGKGGYQFVYLALKEIEPRSVWTPYHPTRVINPSAVHDQIQQLLMSYDFMIVVERMDESLTALALLTGLSLADVLVTSSKVAGSYLLVRVGQEAGQCRRQLKATISEGIKNYTESDEWLAMNYADEILFRAANASLDRTIDRIGRDLFTQKLEEFLQLKERVLHTCGSRLGFGCSDEGEPLAEEQCYFRDFGCGYSCVDSVTDRAPG